MSHRIWQGVATVSVAVLLFVSVGGPVAMAQMVQHHGAPMAGCPFMGTTAALCPMSSVDHVGLMRSLLLAIVTGTIVFFGVVLLQVVLRLARWLSLRYRQRWRTAVRYVVFHPFAMIGSPLRQALARGLLHPKVYPSPAI